MTQAELEEELATGWLASCYCTLKLILSPVYPTRDMEIWKDKASLTSELECLCTDVLLTKIQVLLRGVIEYYRCQRNCTRPQFGPTWLDLNKIARQR